MQDRGSLDISVILGQTEIVHLLSFDAVRVKKIPFERKVVSIT